MDKGSGLSLLMLRQALEASWGPDTAYRGISEAGNPALGNCYPTARVIQHYFPDTDIAEGQVRTEKGTEKHFWNVINVDGTYIHVDYTWQQFPHGSYVISWKIRDRKTLGDGEDTIRRVNLLLERVQKFLELTAAI